MSLTQLSLAEIEKTTFVALCRSGSEEKSARSMAKSIMAAERDGVASHGLRYVPIYCEHLQCGKVSPTAIPQLIKQSENSFAIDADCGFAHPAIDLGFESLVPAAKKSGCAALSISRSYNCGVLGYHAERLAQDGLIGLGFTNAPASIAPIGGTVPVIGTNPFSLAVPDGKGGAAFVIDQSASVVAKSEIMLHASRKKNIPFGWAFDAEGQETEDPALALKGSMAPAGGQKGFGFGLLTEVLAAVLAGGFLGKEASPFSGTIGGPPQTGQFFMALSPQFFGGAETFSSQLTDLQNSIVKQPGARIPGSKRSVARSQSIQKGVSVSTDLLQKIRSIGETNH